MSVLEKELLVIQKNVRKYLHKNEAKVDNSDNNPDICIKGPGPEEPIAINANTEQIVPKSPKDSVAIEAHDSDEKCCIFKGDTTKHMTGMNRMRSDVFFDKFIKQPSSDYQANIKNQIELQKNNPKANKDSKSKSKKKIVGINKEATQKQAFKQITKNLRSKSPIQKRRRSMAIQPFRNDMILVKKSLPEKAQDETKMFNFKQSNVKQMIEEYYNKDALYDEVGEKSVLDLTYNKEYNFRKHANDGERFVDSYGNYLEPFMRMADGKASMKSHAVSGKTMKLENEIVAFASPSKKSNCDLRTNERYKAQIRYSVPKKNSKNLLEKVDEDTKSPL